jgi:hypothetical protein
MCKTLISVPSTEEGGEAYIRRILKNRTGFTTFKDYKI